MPLGLTGIATIWIQGFGFRVWGLGFGVIGKVAIWVAYRSPVKA